jgi:DNA-binding NtrC family response regulator
VIAPTDPPNAILETLLVVDDDVAALKMIVSILERAHFRVLSAHSGAEGIKLAAETKEQIHLLLSDVDMPEMSGPEVGKALKTTRPDLRVMLMSGGDNGLLVLNYGWTYLQKPFLAARLVQMVNDVLHSEDRSQSSNQFDIRKDTGKKS